MGNSSSSSSSSSPSSSSSIPDGEVQIECRQYYFQGGAPPHRGFHYNSSFYVQGPSDSTTSNLITVVKRRIDPSNERDLSYYLIKEDKKEVSLPRNEPLNNIATNKKITIRVNIPYANGGLDVGTFDMMVSSPGADILMGKKKELSGHEVSHLLSHFEGARVDGGRFEEFSEVLTKEECGEICTYIDRRFERAGVNAVEDFKVILKPQQLCELVSDEKSNELFELFDAECHEIILRRSTSGGKFINFHLDHALQTLNIPLNDAQSYQGGRLIYVKEDRLILPERKTGSATLHTNEIVHGVTPILEGVRYAMFLLHHKEE